MKLFIFILLIFGIVILISPACSKDKEFCWECTTTFTIKSNPDIVVHCEKTKSEAEYIERQGTKSYTVYGQEHSQTTKCKKQK